MDSGFFPKLSESNPVKNRLLNIWLSANNVEDAGPSQDYDYLGAYRGGMMRGVGQQGHFTDKYKMPTHESFSNESKYYKPGMSAVNWVGDNPMPDLGSGKLNKSIYNRLKIGS